MYELVIYGPKERKDRKTGNVTVGEAVVERVPMGDAVATYIEAVEATGKILAGLGAPLLAVITKVAIAPIAPPTADASGLAAKLEKLAAK